MSYYTDFTLEELIQEYGRIQRSMGLTEGDSWAGGGVGDEEEEAQEVLEEILERTSAVREALNWMVHLAHGVGKDGKSPTADEYEAAVDHAEELLERPIQ